MTFRVSLVAGLLLAASACAAAPDPAPEPAPELADAGRPDAIGALIESRDAPVAAPAPAPSATPAASVAPSQPPKPGAGSLDAYLDGLRALSCPKGVRAAQPEPLELGVAPVPLSGLNRGLKRVGELTYVGGFHLTSPDARFGGLSGLDLLDDGRLLAVSDQGDFVWIELSPDGVIPVGARIAGMQDASGASLRGKADGDAEGLAVNDGLALVSFERNHRVLAFDIGGCGAAARGAPIVTAGYGRSLERSFDLASLDVGSNAGPEPLGVTRDWFMFTGVETLKAGRGPLSARPVEAAPEFTLSVEREAPAFVGLDLLPAGEDGKDVRAFSVHRGADQLLGNAIIISETTFERHSDGAGAPAGRASEIDERSRLRFRAKQTRRLAQMSVILTIDNYEGIAARELPDGRVRLYVLSDDNFSSRQRTLLMVFDLPAA